MFKPLPWQQKELLHRKQEDMRYRMELERDKPEIDELLDRTDLKCPYCTKEFTTASARTGEILPCKRCKVRRVILYKYKLTLRKFAEMLREQYHRCAICNIEFDYKTKGTTPNVDHCHDVGHNRGLLCGACNMGLGFFKDDAEYMERAVKYLKTNRFERRWWFQKYLS